MSYQVFISFKNLDAGGNPTRDSRIAAELYHKLKACGINVFFSNEEVQRRCRPDYGDLIDEALESARILMLVGTSAEYIDSRWVRYEWNSFKNEINSGRKDGYIIPVLEGVSVGELPFALRHGQVYSSDDMNAAVDMVAGVLGMTGTGDDSLYQVSCPGCGEPILLSGEELDSGGIDCPKCGQAMEFDLAGIKTENYQITCPLCGRDITLGKEQVGIRMAECPFCGQKMQVDW